MCSFWCEDGVGYRWYSVLVFFFFFFGGGLGLLLFRALCVLVIVIFGFLYVGGVLGVQGRFRCCFHGVWKAWRLDGGFGWVI